VWGLAGLGAFLSKTLPSIRGPLQLSGFLVAIAAALIVQTISPGNTRAMLAAGGIGVSLVIFGQLFHFLTSFRLRDRALVFIGAFAIFCLFTLAMIGLTALFVFIPTPATASDFSLASSDPRAEGLPVDLDELLVHWNSSGDPEDVSVTLEAMDSGKRTEPKRVRSNENEVSFKPDEYAALLSDRTRNGSNRIRVIMQTAKDTFYSRGFQLHVGTKIVAIRFDDERIRFAAMIDNRGLLHYRFEAKLVVWGKRTGQQLDAITLGGWIDDNNSSVPLDPSIEYRWDTAKLVYLGPDNLKNIRTELLGF